MKRTDKQLKRFHAWAKRTGYDFGTKRAGGSRISQSAIDQMRHKPYGGLCEQANTEEA